MAKPKVKLGNSPKNFTKSVDVVLINGAVAAIDISYIYRTRSQFAELIDGKIAADAEIAKKAAAEVEKTSSQAAPGDDADTTDTVKVTAKDKTVAEWFKLADEGGVEYILKIADGWDLSDPFTEKSLLQLENENPGSLAAIATTYRQAVADARVKN